MNLIKQTKICVGLHQEDERKSRVAILRPNIDIGLAILRWTTEGLQLIDLCDYQQSRECQIEMTLEPGSYIILPRTTGCLLNHKSQPAAKDPNGGSRLFEKKEKIIPGASV